MKVLKWIVIVLLILIAIPLVAALFVSGEYQVERSVVVEIPKDQTFEYLKYLKNQNDYSKWAGMDPDMKKTYTGTDGTVGFVSAWESDKEDVGSGEQEILKITEGERIDYELRFLKPFESTSQAWITTENEGDNATKITWGFKGSMNYPMNLMLVFMDMEQMIGDDLQTGLNNLKGQLEK